MAASNPGMRAYFFPIGITALLCLCAVEAAYARDQYTVRFEPDEGIVSVKLCFDGPAPSRLHRHSTAHRYAGPVTHDGTTLSGWDRKGSLRTGRLPNNACIHWESDLDKAARSGDQRRTLRTGHDYVTATQVWFWQARGREAEVAFDLPRGISVSVPWQPHATRADTYLTDSSPPWWSSRSAFGRFRVEPVALPGGELRVAIPGEISAQHRTKLVTWMRAAAESVVAVSGTFPQPSTQVLVVPIGRRSSAVPWAHVVRGGGVTVEFFVDETRSLDQLKRDWTAVHEFSHLLLPYVSSRDRWLSEGLASYYQNVLRARNGTLEEREAWQKLHDGFERGERGTRGGSLADATRGGWGSTMRVYWSGAAMMLMADARLRELSGGRQSLDDVLAELHTCCLANGKSWRARELLQRMDAISGTRVFSDLYETHVYDDDFPDVSETFEDLGVNPGRGRVSLANDAPLNEVRADIMSG